MSSRDEAGTGGAALDRAVPDVSVFDALLDDARVPLPEIHRALEALEARTRALGDGPRAVHRLRHRLARQLGHTATAQQEFDLWLAAPRDLSCGCLACEQGQAGDWFAERGEDARALDAWDAVISGSLFCDAQPHGVLARSLLPLVRLGRTRQAEAAHVEGYRIARLKPAMCAAIGAHIEFCALTGNAARGLELLAEHGHWLAGGRAPGRFDRGEEAAPWRLTGRYADFLGGAGVLLRQLAESGFDDLPFAVAGAVTMPLGDLREEVDARLSALAARFDERNGTAAFSGRILRRSNRQPFLSSVSLDACSVLPDPSARAGGRAAARTSGTRRRPVEDLVAEARRLTRLWHPAAQDAWQRAQEAAEAGGRALDDAARIEFDEQRLLADAAAAGRGEGGARLSDGVAAAVLRARLLEVAERYRAQGLVGRALHASVRAAFALLRSGQVEAAASDQAALRLAAADALTGREITPEEYLAVRIGSGYQKFHLWQRLATGQEATRTRAADPAGGEPSPWFGGRPGAGTDPDAAATAAAAEEDSALRLEEADGCADPLSAAARAALAELGEVIEECRRFDTGQAGVGRYGAAAAGMAAQLRLAGGEVAAAERDLRLAAELDHASGAPWCAAAAELNLGRLAFARGDLPAAERYARAAVEHELDPQARGQAAMLLAEALWLQDGRAGEALAPALAAATAFARREDGAGDAARARLRAAEALAAAGRAQEAIALFEPALTVADAHWDEEEWKPVLAQAARAYGKSLIAVGDPRRAAQLLSGMADRVKDWANQVPHAMLAADAASALERAGRHGDAAAAFQRAAELWGSVGEPLTRVRCLRSAARSLAADDVDAAFAVIDGAGGELLAVLASDDADAALRRSVRYELAETHVQRARIVLNLAGNRLLAARDADRLLGQAHQHATAAVNGLRRLITSGSAPGDLLPERLAVARITVARLEGRDPDRAAIAAARLRDWAGEFESWDRPDLARRLRERAQTLSPSASAESAVPALPAAQPGPVRYQAAA